MTYAYRIGCGSSHHIFGCCDDADKFNYTQRSEIRKLAREESKRFFNDMLTNMPKVLKAMTDLGVVD